MVYLSVSYGQFLGSTFKTYGEEEITDDSFITAVGSIAAIANGISRGIWATLQDKYGFKTIFFIILVVEICLSYTLSFIRYWKILYLIWITLSLFWMGGHFSITPTVYAKIYGLKTGGKVYSFMFSTYLLSNTTGLVLAKLMLPNYGYNAIFLVLSIMITVSFVLLFYFKEEVVMIKRKIWVTFLCEFFNLDFHQNT
jgi:MFS family permease